MVQDDNSLTDAGGRMIAEGLKGNCIVTAVSLVSAGLFSVRLLLLTRVEQKGNEDMSDAVKREITQGLQEGHGADKGVAVTAGWSCRFFDFETCEDLSVRNTNVCPIFSLLHDAA